VLHTIVATPFRRPKISAIHAPVIPEGVGTYIAIPFFARHFYVVAKHRAPTLREEGRPCTRVRAQIKTTIGFVVSIPQF
jgi:hypothetical protein